MEGDKVAMELASQAKQLLEGHSFPAPKKDLVRRAEQLGADPDVLQALQQAPEGVYASAGELAEHVRGKHPND